MVDIYHIKTKKDKFLKHTLPENMCYFKISVNKQLIWKKA